MLIIERNGKQITLSATKKWMLYLVIGTFVAGVSALALLIGGVIAYATM